MSSKKHNENSSNFMRLDLSLRVVLGLSGVLITILLGYGQLQVAKIQNTLAQQQIVLQTLTMVNDYLPLVDEQGNNGQRARRIIKTAAAHLSNEYSSPILAEIANSLLEESEIPSTDKEVFQIAESTQPPTSKDYWFTVVASFNDTELENAKHKAIEIASLQNEYKVELYRTRISRHIAVTIGGKLSKSEALQLAGVARGKGWAYDAFAQVDRDWIKIQ